MIREIFGRVLTCVLWSMAVVVVQRFIFVPGGWSIAIPETAHALVGVALGLLLVFRTNASYDRFWEGRKQWGSIVNECRNLGRAASVHLADAPDLVRSILDWTTVFTFATMHRLRGTPLVVPATLRLHEDEARNILAAGHVPLAIARRLSELIAQGHKRRSISDMMLVTLDQNVQLLIDYLGACERIHNTPMPFAYMVHLRRALILYSFTLPLALVDRFGWWTVPAVPLVAYVMYGIEEIGVETEDPFGTDENDLPLEEICQSIAANLCEILDTLPPTRASTVN